MTEKYYIPLELTIDNVIPEEYQNCKICWSKIGNRKIKAILIPATKEQYYAYMRPEWREDKRKQRHGVYEKSVDEACDVYELELKDDFNLEDNVISKLLLSTVAKEMSNWSDKDRKILSMLLEGASERYIGETVGMSQKGVNKRKHVLLDKLRSILENAYH